VAYKKEEITPSIASTLKMYGKNEAIRIEINSGTFA
jgi:hypothetical protein